MNRCELIETSHLIQVIHQGKTYRVWINYSLNEVYRFECSESPDLDRKELRDIIWWEWLSGQLRIDL